MNLASIVHTADTSRSQPDGTEKQEDQRFIGELLRMHFPSHIDPFPIPSPLQEVIVGSTPLAIIAGQCGRCYRISQPLMANRPLPIYAKSCRWGSKSCQRFVDVFEYHTPFAVSQGDFCSFIWITI